MKETGRNLYSSGMLNEKKNEEKKEINHVFKSLGGKILTYEVLQPLIALIILRGDKGTN